MCVFDRVREANTLLITAAKCGDGETMRHAVTLGADLFDMALSEAAKCACMEGMKIALELGATSSEGALVASAQVGYVEGMRWAEKHGAICHATAFKFAVDAEELETAQYCLHDGKLNSYEAIMSIKTSSSPCAVKWARENIFNEIT